MKKVLLPFFFLLLSVTVCGQVFEVGVFQANKTTYPAYTLDKGEGLREINLEIRFTEMFRKKPEIMLGVTLLDMEKDENIRYKMEVSFVTTEGFVLKIMTWGNTRIFNIGGNWMAISDE